MSFPQLPRNRRRATDFEVGVELGNGSLSSVHVGIEVATGKQFALKIFNKQYVKNQKKEADITIEEHCLRRANHPGVAKLHALFADEHSTYMALELCPGGELWNKVKDAGCSDRVGAHYLAQVVEALSYLRDAQIVHRDVKAENVMIGARGNIKLVDFGSAKDLANPQIKGAGTHSFKKVLEDNVGTPNFMAPEVINNKRSDFRSDIWSFGCTVFQVLTGLPPFGFDLVHVYKRALKAKLTLPPGLSEDARHLIEQVVVVDPSYRLGASNIRDLRAHRFFAAASATRALGPRFEGAHKLAAPVPSLEELCLSALGKGWKDGGLGTEAIRRFFSGAGQAERELRPETQEVLKRFHGAAERARRRAAKADFRDDDAGVSSDEEPVELPQAATGAE